MPTIVEILQSADSDNGRPTYERLADVVAGAIKDGTVAPGSRLPTVRSLSSELRVSATTVMSMYARLAEGGYTSGEPGRGTFVRDVQEAAVESTVADRPARRAPSRAWRRQSLAEAEMRLRQRNQDAVDLTRGSPARDLLPAAILGRAWAKTAGDVTSADLEYPHTLAIDERLWAALGGRLRRDGLQPDPSSLLAMNSTQQFYSMIVRMLERRQSPAKPRVAVEEPGYQTAMDTFERAGCQLVGMSVDLHGVTPGALRGALAQGVDLVVFTPRGLSPTGATWTEERRRELAEVLAPAHGTWILEDDYFAELASSRPGSLAADARLKDRTLYVRGFSKSVGPDLRVAVGVAGGSLLPGLLEERSFCDGWTSSFTQRALAVALADPELDPFLEESAAQYRAARTAFFETWALETAEVAGAVAEATPDGLHVWLTLPAGTRSTDVIQRCAANGYLVTSGEPFFLQPGNRDHIRVNVGAVGAAGAGAVARAIVAAMVDVRGTSELLFAP